MTKKFRIWGLVQDRLSPASVTHGSDVFNAYWTALTLDRQYFGGGCWPER